MPNVQSSHISTIDYNADSRTLTVKFTNGAVYQYLAVPQFIYTALNLAPSKGEYFAKYIKGKYQVKKVKK